MLDRRSAWRARPQQDEDRVATSTLRKAETVRHANQTQRKRQPRAAHHPASSNLQAQPRAQASRPATNLTQRKGAARNRKMVLLPLFFLLERVAKPNHGGVKEFQQDLRLPPHLLFHKRNRSRSAHGILLSEVSTFDEWLHGALVTSLSQANATSRRTNSSLSASMGINSPALSLAGRNENGNAAVPNYGHRVMKRGQAARSGPRDDALTRRWRASDAPRFL